LADQYKILDAASAIAKRHVLAEHLKEVIDTLEQKVSSEVHILRKANNPGGPDRITLRSIIIQRSTQFPKREKWSKEISTRYSENGKRVAWGRRVEEITRRWNR